MSHRRTLILVALAGLAIGFVAMRLWRPGPAEEAAPPPAHQDVAGEPVLPPLPPVNAAGETGHGSSMSVVGGMSREEMVRRGLIPAAGQPAAGVAADRAPAGGQTPLAVDQGEGPPAARRFPSAVAAAAGRYMCLCGCRHRLDQCPCNDQPIGAVTMLSYLQKLLGSGAEPAALDAGMVDRYGEQVMATPPAP